MSIEITLAEAPAEVRDLATAVTDFAVEHMLRSVRVFNGTHIITVEEPSIWSDDPDLHVTVEEFDL